MIFLVYVSTTVDINFFDDLNAVVNFTNGNIYTIVCSEAVANTIKKYKNILKIIKEY